MVIVRNSFNSVIGKFVNTTHATASYNLSRPLAPLHLSLVIAPGVYVFCLSRLAEIVEAETEAWYKIDPDPFDDRHPGRYK